MIQGTIPHYRVPVFNELARRVDLTVVYSYGDLPEGIEFKTLLIPTVKRRFLIHKKNLYLLAQKYDVVISVFDFTYLYVRLLYLLPHKYKLIFWGIGVSAGYNCRYDSNQNIAAKLFKAIKRSDAVVFYCDYPKGKYAKMGIPNEKMFVANNTVTVKVAPIETKDSILFIGSLYKAKKIHELLENYSNAFAKNPNIPKLVIIGDGDEYENVLKWIKSNRLSDKIILTGAIYEDEMLAKYFARALVCISPDQAGLSVLKSMGNGVPYATHTNAITGGEIFNITNGENGILFEDFSEIEKIILDSAARREEFLAMGRKAKEYYDANRTIPQMVDGFSDAVAFASGKKK